MFLDRKSESLAFGRAGQEAAAFVFVARKTFLFEEALFFGDVNGDPMTDVVVHIRDEKRLI